MSTPRVAAANEDLTSLQALFFQQAWPRSDWVALKFRPQRAIQTPELLHHPVLDVFKGRVVILDIGIARKDGHTARLVVVEPLPVQRFTEFRFDGFAFPIQEIEQHLVGGFVRIQIKLDASLLGIAQFQ